jgi:four helix bundle protein
MKDNILLQKSKQFALDIIRLYQLLQKENEYVLSKQVLRSGTSIGANIHEAVVGQSKRDFFAKICIALKEANETIYWLDLLQESHITKIDVSIYQSDCDEITRILAATKKTTELNLENEK